MDIAEQPSETLEADVQEPTRVAEFAKTARAAKLSGSFHESLGFVKRKLGEITENGTLQNSGKNQELLGKLHGLVGAVREVREAAVLKLQTKRTLGAEILRDYSGKLLTGMTEFTRELKKLLE